MADFQTDVLDHLARVVGGTVTTYDAAFFSGDKVGDATGVSGLKGCYSKAPRALAVSTPVAIVMPGPFSAELMGGQGKEFNEDEVKILVLVAPYDNKSQMGVLTPYRDSVPAAFRAHMQAYSIPDGLDAWIVSGRAGVHEYAGTDYLAWEFTCRVRRLLNVIYAA